MTLNAVIPLRGTTLVNRPLLGAAGVVASLGIAACGSASASGASTPSASPSSGGRTGLARNATFGQLVQINGSTLILSSSTGDSTVTYATTTTITQTSTGSLANVTPGLCITATGTKDATGALVATTVLLSAPVSGSCTTGFGGGGGGTFSPPAGATPRTELLAPGRCRRRARSGQVGDRDVCHADRDGGHHHDHHDHQCPDHRQGDHLVGGPTVGVADRAVSDCSRYQE